MTAISELKRTKKRIAVTSMCVGTVSSIFTPTANIFWLTPLLGYGHGCSYRLRAVRYCLLYTYLMLRVLLANETVLYGPGYLAVAYRLSKLFIYIPMIGKKFRYCLGRNGVNSMLETQVHSSDLAHDMAR